jgi:hypothetical protein
MPVTHTLAANFTQSIGKALVLPAGVKSMFFFGTGGDGNNANRVSGGPVALTIGSPAFASNYVTVGYNGTTNNVIDTANQRNSAMLTAGWTWAAVFRCTSVGAVQGILMEDAGGGGSAVPAIGTVCGMAFNASGGTNMFLHSGGQSTRATHVLGSGNNNWHFAAISYSGGAAGTHTLNNFTDNIAGGTPATFVASGLAAGNNSPCLGGNVPPGTTGNTYLADVAWAMVAQGPMIQTDLAALAASVRPWLARRGVVC